MCISLGLNAAEQQCKEMWLYPMFCSLLLGKEEAWFKMEENNDYYSARPKSRVTSAQGHECHEKMTKANQNEW